MSLGQEGPQGPQSSRRADFQVSVKTHIIDPISDPDGIASSITNNTSELMPVNMNGELIRRHKFDIDDHYTNGLKFYHKIAFTIQGQNDGSDAGKIFMIGGTSNVGTHIRERIFINGSDTVFYTQNHFKEVELITCPANTNLTYDIGVTTIGRTEIIPSLDSSVATRVSYDTDVTNAEYEYVVEETSSAYLTSPSRGTVVGGPIQYHVRGLELDSCVFETVPNGGQESSDVINSYESQFSGISVRIGSNSTPSDDDCIELRLAQNL